MFYCPGGMLNPHVDHCSSISDFLSDVFFFILAMNVLPSFIYVLTYISYCGVLMEPT